MPPTCPIWKPCSSIDRMPPPPTSGSVRKPIADANFDASSSICVHANAQAESEFRRLCEQMRAAARVWLRACG